MRQHSSIRTGIRAAAAVTALAVAGAVASTAVLAAVFGSDDRVEMPPRLDAVGRSVGMLFNNEARTVCTAFCVSDNTIATAAHCLFKTAGETPPRVADFWFGRLNGSNSREFARIAGVTTASTPQHVMAGSTQLRVRPPIDATRDWALVRLSRPLCRGAALPIKVLPPDELVRQAELLRGDETLQKEKLDSKIPTNIPGVSVYNGWTWVRLDMQDSDFFYGTLTYDQANELRAKFSGVKGPIDETKKAIEAARDEQNLKIQKQIDEELARQKKSGF